VSSICTELKFVNHLFFKEEGEAKEFKYVLGSIRISILESVGTSLGEIKEKLKFVILYDVLVFITETLFEFEIFSTGLQKKHIVRMLFS